MTSHLRRVVPIVIRATKRRLLGLNGQTEIPLPRHFWGRRPWSDPFSEIAATMRYMDRQMRDFDREMTKIFGELEKLSPVKLPRVKFGDEQRNVPIEVSGDGSRRFHLTIDVSEFKPEDVKVTIRNRILMIHAKSTDVSAAGDRIHQEYSRQITLPDDVNPEAVRSILSPTGILNIEAPLPSIEPPAEKEIPVEIEQDTETDKSTLSNKA